MVNIPSGEANKSCSSQETNLILGNLRVQYHVQQSPPLLAILSQKILVYVLPFQFMEPF